MHSPCQSHSDEYHSGLARTATALQRDQAAQLIRASTVIRGTTLARRDANSPRYRRASENILLWWVWISRVASSRLPVDQQAHGGRREREQPAHCQQDEPSLYCVHARSLHDAHAKRADVRSFHLAFSV